MSERHELFKLRLLAQNTSRRLQDYRTRFVPMMCALKLGHLGPYEQHEAEIMTQIGVYGDHA